jgi:hypothetical protein
MLGKQFINAYSASGEPREEKQASTSGATHHAGACDHRDRGLSEEDYRCTRADSSNFQRCTSPRCHIGTWEYAFGYFSAADCRIQTVSWDDEIAKVRTFRPRSSSVRSSTLPAMTFHRQSTSEIYPLHRGLAAVSANYIHVESERKIKNARAVGVEDRVYHYGSDGDKGIIHSACVLNTTTLEGQLKTAAAHAKAHRVHINMVDESGTMPRL